MKGAFAASIGGFNNFPWQIFSSMFLLFKNSSLGSILVESIHCGAVCRLGSVLVCTCRKILTGLVDSFSLFVSLLKVGKNAKPATVSLHT